MNKIIFQDTHIYPGCLAIFPLQFADHRVPRAATAEFSDGSLAAAELEEVKSGEFLVHVDTYTTMRGTAIPKKSWRLKHYSDRDVWKVVKKDG